MVIPVVLFQQDHADSTWLCVVQRTNIFEKNSSQPH
jgi:hypothetical protein